MKTYKVGIIGFGFIGKVHALCHQNLQMFYNPCDFRSEIKSVCTSRAETAAAGAQQLGGSVKACTDFREITEDPEIDIVNICTPNDRHKEALLSAIAAGKHIYCDKPLTATYAEALEIAAALENYRGISQMTLHYRFYPVTLRAKQIIEEGLIGDILEFRGSFLHSGSADPCAPLKWKLSGAAGGGVAADLGSHILDLMEYLVGPFEELSAATHTAYPERPSFKEPGKMEKVDAEDNMHATVRLANGATGFVHASKIATGTEDEVSFEIYGTKGAIRMVPLDLHHLYYYDCSLKSAPIGGVRGWTAIDCGQRYDPPAGFPAAKSTLGWLRGHQHCLYNFMNAVHQGKPANPDLARGIFIQYLLDKVKESAATRQWVKL